MRHSVIVLLLCAVTPAQAASLKPMTVLHAPVVRLQDLFADAGPDGAHVLGPGPGPGGQIVVEASQLAYIARHYGVDWRPASTGDRAVLSRPGRPLTRKEVMAPLRAALTEAGAQSGCDIDLAGFNPPLVPAEGSFIPVIGGMQYDQVSGRFDATLAITGPTIDPISVELAGRAENTVTLPVAAARLPIGTIVTAADLRLARVRVSQVTGEVVEQPAGAVGLQLHAQIAAGQPLPRAALGAPMLVRKGALVTMLLDTAGISLSAEGQALEAGGHGDSIRVMNPVSHAVVEAEVTGEGQVRVMPGAMPLVPAGGVRSAAVIAR
ncbi:MAG: flagellar basal body P-ring formation chaperone FlgA [Acetobacteraceae bacterium]